MRNRRKHIEVRCLDYLGAFLSDLWISLVNLQDLRKGLTDLREGLKRIREELVEHFADLDDQAMYGKQMWSFVNKANGQVEDLVHDVNNAESTFVDAITYFGEDEKNMTSSEFYGIFKTFVTSYKVGLLELGDKDLVALTVGFIEMQVGESDIRGAESRIRTTQAAVGREPCCSAAKGAGNGHGG